MPKLIQTNFPALLVILRYTSATYSNLLYNAYSEAYPGLYNNYCGTSCTAWATDRFITLYEPGADCVWPGYLFLT